MTIFPPGSAQALIWSSSTTTTFLKGIKKWGFSFQRKRERERNSVSLLFFLPVCRETPTPPKSSKELSKVLERTHHARSFR